MTDFKLFMKVSLKLNGSIKEYGMKRMEDLKESLSDCLL